MLDNYNISTVNLPNYTLKYCLDGFLGRGVKLTSVVLIDSLGILGNVFVIVLAMKLTARKILHHLIISMSIADALFLAVDLLSAIPYFSLDPLPIPNNILGTVICKTKAFIINVSYRVSLAALLVISIQRFRATRQTLQRSHLFTLKQRVAMIALCWFIPMIFSIDKVYSADVENRRCNTFQFYVKFLYVQSYIISSFNISLNSVVAVVILVLSICTIRRLSKPQDIYIHLNEEQRNRRISRTRAAARMVLASVLLYTCCWLPSLSYFSQITLGYDFLHFFPNICTDSMLLAIMVLSYLPLVNCCFSPYIYIIFLPDFREAAKKVFCRNAINRRMERRNSMELLQISRPKD